jgi:hypothetical protein
MGSCPHFVQLAVELFEVLPGFVQPAPTLSNRDDLQHNKGPKHQQKRTERQTFDFENYHTNIHDPLVLQR